MLRTGVTLYPGQAWYSYYFAGASQIALRIQSNQLNLDDGVFYFLSDYLGGTAITLDANGAKTAELRYTAWGETRYTSGSTPTQRRYTGQLQAEAGLYFYNARWYDPSLGRFAQADTIVPLATQGTQAWDRYAYVNSNPIMNADPSGHCVGPLLFTCILVANYIAANEAVIIAVVVTAAVTLPWVTADTPRQDSNQSAEESIIEATGASLTILTAGEGVINFGRAGSLPKSAAKAPAAQNIEQSELVSPHSGDLIKVPKPDFQADKLAKKLNGMSSVKFSNDPSGREFDVISDKYVGQTTSRQTIGSQWRTEAKATFEAAKATGRTPYFNFETGLPNNDYLRALERYKQRYEIDYIIDTDPF